jgi:hypothetical protein
MCAVLLHGHRDGSKVRAVLTAAGNMLQGVQHASAQEWVSQGASDLVMEQCINHQRCAETIGRYGLTVSAESAEGRKYRVASKYRKEGSWVVE